MLTAETFNGCKVTRMRRALLLNGAAIAMLGAAPFAIADNAISTAAEPVQIAQTATGTATTTPDANADSSTLVNTDGSLNASMLIGLDVQSPENQKVGDIGEVVLDKDGEVEGVVVDVGGFLGIATHPVLLDWEDVTLASQDGKDRAVVNLTKEKLEQMPAYEVSRQ